jgi:hypothetical protein
MPKKTFLYGVLILLFLLTGTILALAAGEGESSGDAPGNKAPRDGAAAAGTAAVTYLYTGSPLILYEGEIKMLDPENPDLCATVINSNTLVPLKAISEYFGAEVDYDSGEKTAIVKYDGREYLFPIGSKKYIVENGPVKKEYGMSSQSLILDGRTMVPLRVICENVLERKVSYHDRIIAVASYEADLRTNEELTDRIRGKLGKR